MLETSKPNGQIIRGSVQLVHAVGMHARPAVKLTKLAKKFQAHISIRPSSCVSRPAMCRTFFTLKARR